MKARNAAILVLGVALAAEPVWAGEQARSRNSGKTEGSSATANQPRPSRGGSRSTPGHTTTAQRRQPRAGTGSGSRHRGVRRHHGGHYGSRHYYGRSYYPYGYFSFSYPYYGYGYGYGYGGSYYYGPGYNYRGRATGALRLQVHPSEAQVYVDGYYAGIVDDYDGLFQRLRLPSGGHEVALKLDGYTTHRLRVYVTSGHTLKIRRDLERGEGETVEQLGEEPEYARGDRERDRWSERSRDDDPWEDRARERDRAERDREADARFESRRTQEKAGGRLRLRIRPDDASVYVDGRFKGVTDGELVLNLTPGQHQVEIVRPGYRTYDRAVEVTRDEPVDLDIELERL